MTLKDKLRRGDAVFGTFAFLPNPNVIEVLALAGMDYVIIDLEHSPKNWETIENMVRAAEVHRMATLIRVSVNEEKHILHALELGVDGIVVPFVNTGADAARAKAAMLYAPDGVRGSCTLTRAAAYGGLRAGFIAHTKKQNERLVLVAQVEDKRGVDAIDDIVAAGPDVVMIGRSDLASSLGKPGMVNEPEVLAATERVLAAVRRAKGCAGIGVYGPGEAPGWIAKGCGFFFYSSDGAILLNAAKSAVDGFRASLAPEKRGAA